MKQITVTIVSLGLAAALAAPAQAKRCPKGSVQVGPICVDTYEASVWEIPAANTRLIKRVQKGRIDAAVDLAGATQHGVTSDDYDPGCPDTAAGCKDFYAVSVPGVTPSAHLTWFQAAAACRNAGKRLLTNAEWQMAAFGTPDPGTDNGTNDCNITSTTLTLPEDPVTTGSRGLCVSDVGAFDMVGNLWEWAGDWGERAGACTSWSATFGTDASCVGGDGSVHLPGALIRGGDFGDGPAAGVFAVAGLFDPSFALFGIGFRCAR